MSTGMMSDKRKKTRLPDAVEIVQVDDSISVVRLEPHQIAVPKPRVTSFVARDCTACTALRESDEKAKGKSFSRVYATVGRTRYCKCGYCGNTWKQIEVASP